MQHKGVINNARGYNNARGLKTSQVVIEQSKGSWHRIATWSDAYILSFLNLKSSCINNTYCLFGL